MRLNESLGGGNSVQTNLGTTVSGSSGSETKPSAEATKCRTCAAQEDTHTFVSLYLILTWLINAMNTTKSNPNFNITSQMESFCSIIFASVF